MRSGPIVWQLLAQAAAAAVFQGAMGLSLLLAPRATFMAKPWQDLEGLVPLRGLGAALLGLGALTAAMMVIRVQLRWLAVALTLAAAIYSFVAIVFVANAFVNHGVGQVGAELFAFVAAITFLLASRVTELTGARR